MAAKKLKIGLLIDSRDLYAWECVMLEKIAKSYFAEIVLVVQNNTAPEKHSVDQRQKIKSLLCNTPKSFLVSLVRRLTRACREKLEYKVGGCVPDAFGVANNFEQFHDIPRLDVTPTQTKFSDYINAIDIERIREFEVDVFIRTGFRIFGGEILNVAKYGIWSLHHADNRINKGSPAGFWEVFHNLPVTGSTLQILSENCDGGKALSRTSSATCPVSVRRNRNSLYWTALFQLPRKLEELFLVGADSFFEKVERDNAHPSVYSNRLFTSPTLSEEIVLVLRIFWRIYSNRIRTFFISSQWILLFEINNEFAPSFFRFKKIIPPSDRFWADPHVLIKDHRYYVFIEEFPYSQNKGYISVMEMEEDGTHTMPRRVLEEPYHLSNPFVFGHGDQLYLIPESAKNPSVDLYRCVSFPDKWERSETLLKDVHAVDTIVHFYQGKWWLFTNIREHEAGSSNDALFLFYSDVLQGGRWKAHPANPIVSDVTRARSAGEIFEHNGKLYRPAQDCSIRYGYGMRIQEILKMSESEYLEREVAFIQPKWDEKIVATHTFSKAGRLVFIDALEEKWELFPGSRRSA